MHRCLKPGGKLLAMHLTIWRSFDRHHLPVSIPERFDRNDAVCKEMYEPWGHLLQSRKQTYQYISTRFDNEFAEEIIYYTYNDNQINRYFSEDYLSVFQAPSVEVVEHQITFP